MAKTKDSGKKNRTLRQTTEDRASVKKRSLRTPVGKIGKPLGRVGSVVRRSPVGKVGRFLLPKYFRNSWYELRQVTWTGARQTARLTIAVIAFATVFGIIIAIVDYGLDKIFRELLLK